MIEIVVDGQKVYLEVDIGTFLTRIRQPEYDGNHVPSRWTSFEESDGRKVFVDARSVSAIREVPPDPVESAMELETAKGPPA